MTLACPNYSYSFNNDDLKLSYNSQIPHPECEPYKQVIRTLTETVHAKDEAIADLQAQVMHKNEQADKIITVAEHTGGTDIETILISVGMGLMGGFILGKAVK